MQFFISHPQFAKTVEPTVCHFNNPAPAFFLASCLSSRALPLPRVLSTFDAINAAGVFGLKTPTGDTIGSFRQTLAYRLSVNKFLVGWRWSCINPPACAVSSLEKQCLSRFPIHGQIALVSAFADPRLYRAGDFSGEPSL